MDRLLLALCACALIATFACDEEEPAPPPPPAPVVDAGAGIARIERPGYESTSGDADSGLSPDPLPPESRSDPESADQTERDQTRESPSRTVVPDDGLSLDLRGSDVSDDGPEDEELQDDEPDEPREEATPPTGGSRPADVACTEHTDCESGICEGLGCGPDEGRCALADRMCTFDYVPYCGCDGVTFQASGSCPGERFSARGPCE